MPQASGLAREAGRLWTSDVYHKRIIRTTCDMIEALEFEPKGEDIRDIGWDGDLVWAMCSSGRIVSYTLAGDPVDVVDGLLQQGWGLTWADGLLWASDPEFSMLYRITLHPDQPYLFYREQYLIDTLGNGNGMLDPGEAAALSIRITNCGGLPTDSLEGLLIENDPWISIGSSQCTYGELPIGGSAANTDEPFTIQASFATPEGHRAPLKLVLTSNGFADTLECEIRVGLPKGDFLVWDADPNRSSGPVVKQLLDSLGYVGEYTTSLHPYFPALTRFRSIWVFCGQCLMREVISRNSDEADSLEAYLGRHGARMYLEGAEVFYFDPINAVGFDFAPLFGLKAVGDGNCDLDTIRGEEGSFASGMVFPYDGENLWIDRLVPDLSVSGFFLLRNNDPPYGCGIGYSGPDRRTVGASFEMSGLVDNPEGMKGVLVDSIMHFFGIFAGQDEKESLVWNYAPFIDCAPNPSREYCLVRCSIPRAATVSMVLHDASGRVVAVLAEGMGEGFHTLKCDVTDMPSGIYFLKLTVDGCSYARKITVIR